MSTRTAYLAAGALGLTLATHPAAAEDPMSAIDWLSDSLSRPAEPPTAEPDRTIATNALPAEVTVEPLGATRPDAVGLLPASAAGLPPEFWGSSASLDVAQRLQLDPVAMLPAIRDLLYRILLAELEPPQDSDASARLFLARIDTLLALGALDQAEALIARAGAEAPEIFRRAFDIGLLTGREAAPCRLLRRTPELSPTFPARVFCLARAGDWNAAALTLETGRALGHIAASENALLARFLDPELFEGQPPLPLPSRPSPLEFRLFEAIGEPATTATLPRAFAQADLRSNIGWKAQVEAAERLAATGAIPANRMLGLYTERRPAASGGVWDRIAAFQAFDTALGVGNSKAVAAALPEAWAAMTTVGLEGVFAELFARELSRIDLPGSAGALAWRIGLLSDDYERIAGLRDPTQPMDRFLAGLARGDLRGITPPGTVATAVADGFAATTPPVRLQTLLSGDRLGEAVLRAMALVTSGSNGDLDEVADGLALLRQAGLETTARQAGLQLLLLDRRG